MYWVKTEGELKMNGQNQPTDFFGTIHDISDLKKIELELNAINLDLFKSKDEILLKNRISNAMILSNEDELFKATLEIILNAFECNSGYFGFIDLENGEKLVYQTLKLDQIENCEEQNRPISIAKEDWNEIWGASLQQQESLYTNTTLPLPFCNIPLKNALAAPILYENDLIGQILVGNKKNAFTDRDQQILDEICQYISPLLHAKLMKRKYSQELIKAKTKSERSEEKYKRLSENTPDLIYTLDLESRHTMVNESACKAMCLTTNEILGKNYIELGFPKELAEEWRNIQLQVIFSGQELKFETATPMPDGYVRTYEVTLTPIFNASQTVIGIRGINRDITEQKKYQTDLLKAVDKIEESETKFRGAFENAGIGMCLVNLQGVFLDVNKALSDILGYTTDELLKLTFQEITLPEDLEIDLKLLYETLDGKRDRYSLVKRYFHKSGEIVYANLFVSLVRNNQLEPQFFVSQIENITKQKEYEQALIQAKEKAEESEQKLMEAQVISRLGSGEWHLDSDEVSWSDEFYRILGYDRSEPIPSFREYTQLFTPQSSLKLSKIFKTVIQSHQPYEAELEMVRKDQTIINVLTRGRIVFDANGTPQKVLGTILDITDRKKLENELVVAKEIAEDNEQKLNEAQEIGQLGSWEWEIETDVVRWSKALYKMIGLNPDQSAPNYKELPKYYKPESFQRLDAAIRECLATGKSYEIELEMITTSQEILTTQTRGRAVKNDAGQIVKLQGIVLDIGKYKLLENDLLKAKNKAEESDRLKSAFLLNMSHEIRTPLNGMLGFIELLNEPDLDEETRKFYMSVVNEGSERLMKTINDIIEISRIEAGDVILTYETIDFDGFMQYYFDFFKPQAEEKRLEIRLNQQIPEAQKSIYTDKHKIDGILSNLIRNAIKYTSSGTVEFGSRIENENLILQVSDTGIGIPEDKANIIFDRFVQVDSSLNKGYEGAGIGLSIVKGYVEALNGTIQLDSEVGKGSTFEVILPLTTKPSPQ